MNCKYCDKYFETRASLVQHEIRCYNNPNKLVQSGFHKGTYQGIRCDSSWELAYIVYCKDHDIDIRRCNERRKYMFNNKEHIYLPDFVVNNNEIVEIKGSAKYSAQWRAKQEQNPDVHTLYEKDIQPYLNYCKDKYGENFWEILYD